MPLKHRKAEITGYACKTQVYLGNLIHRRLKEKKKEKTNVKENRQKTDKHNRVAPYHLLKRRESILRMKLFSTNTL